MFPARQVWRRQTEGTNAGSDDVAGFSFSNIYQIKILLAKEKKHLTATSSLDQTPRSLTQSNCLGKRCHIETYILRNLHSPSKHYIYLPFKQSGIVKHSNNSGLLEATKIMDSIKICHHNEFDNVLQLSKYGDMKKYIKKSRCFKAFKLTLCLLRFCNDKISFITLTFDCR